MGTCVICGVAREHHQPCAVCDTPGAAHWRLCDHCDGEKANSEWSRDDRSKVSTVGDISTAEFAAPDITFGELSSRHRRRGPKPVKKGRVLRLLYARDELVEVRRIDDRGRFRGYYWRRQPMSRRAIARRAGCSPRYVNRLFYEAVSCTFPRR